MTRMGDGMRSQLINDDQARTFALVFATGDEVIETLTAFARAHEIDAASFTGLGAFSEARLGFFDLDRKDYRPIAIAEQVEVLSLVGNVALDQGEPKIHAHVVVGTRDGAARGGHLLSARVRPTLEVVLVEAPAHLRRRHDSATGLPLLDLPVEGAD
jgi:predicted DNA-binding protein with PD1-like motif